MSSKQEPKVTNERPVSLFGPDFKELLKAFLQVKPDEGKEKPKEKTKKKPGD